MHDLLLSKESIGISYNKQIVYHGIKMKFFLIIVLSCFALPAIAHHGVSGQFDRNTKVNVTGVVTDIRLVNPHAYVYFNVTGPAGETQKWRCELRGGSLLTRSGWTKEMFAVGTKITVFGSQAWREEYGCYTETITFENGRVIARNEVIEEQQGAVISKVKLAKGTPVLHGHWVTPGRREPPSPVATALARASWPSDVPIPRARKTFSPTQAGIDAVGDNFNVEEMNPRYHCQATNIFHDWWFDMHVNKIEQSDDKIILTYGFMDIVRTIHLDMNEHPDNIVPSITGHSIGRWEGDTLIVDTIGFKEGWLFAFNNGIKHSDQMHTVERFDKSPDDQWLMMTYTINDALFLNAPLTAQIAQRRTSAPFEAVSYTHLTLPTNREV